MQTNLTTLPAGANGVDQQDKSNHDPAVAGFLTARALLQQRMQELETEIDTIRKLLNGGQNHEASTQALPPAPAAPAQSSVASEMAPRQSNAGLTQAVVNLITQHGPQTKDQIVELLIAQNFQFFGKPKPALDPVLYGKKFQRHGKLFGLAANPVLINQISQPQPGRPLCSLPAPGI